MTDFSGRSTWASERGYLLRDELHQFWANNNGNISFNGGISAFVPTGRPAKQERSSHGESVGDVDTRNRASGVLIETISEEVMLTWDQVGYRCTRREAGQLSTRGERPG